MSLPIQLKNPINMRKLLLLFLLGVYFCKSYAYDTIYVSTDLAVHLIFEDSITDMHCLFSETYVSSEDLVEDLPVIELQKVNKHEIMLYLNDEIDVTNLSVKTTTGAYMFLLMYKHLPEILYYKIRREQAIDTFETILTLTQINQSGNSEIIEEEGGEIITEVDGVIPFDTVCKYIIENEHFTMVTGKRDLKMELIVNTPFIEGQYIFFNIYLMNLSKIPFDIRNELTFYIEDKSKLKKQTVASQILSPKFIYNKDQTTIEKGNPVDWVYVFDKFTLAKQKRLYIHLLDKDGGRDIQLVLNHKHILDAKSIKEFQ